MENNTDLVIVQVSFWCVVSYNLALAATGKIQILERVQVKIMDLR